MQRAQAEFVACLEELTRERRARWVRSADDPGLILCRIQDRLIIFEAYNGSAKLVDPDGEVAGIVCNFSNRTLLWLTPLEEGQKMLALLRKSKIDDEQIVKWRVNAFRPGMKFLKNALKKGKGR
jgi:hypothetical protein